MTHTRRPLAVLLFLLAGFGPTATAQTTQQAARPDLSILLDRATDGLGLTAVQAQRVDVLSTRTGEAGPGTLWSVASALQEILTPAQIDRLQGERPAARASRGARQARAALSRMRRGGRASGARVVTHRATDAQREAARALRDRYRPQAQALLERYRSGAMTDDAFLAESRRLREAAAAERAAALTPEQRARLDEQRARREAAHSARETALNLTAAQKERLQALRLQRVKAAPARLGPDDPRPSRNEARQQLEAARERGEALRTEMESVLTDSQKDLLSVHHALAQSARPDRGEPRHRPVGARRGRR